VVRREGDRYQLVVGERRFRAARMAGRTSIPAIVRDIADDESLKYALMENLQREDLNPVEEAKGFATLKDRYGLSVTEIARIIGRDRSTVANSIRLLALPAGVIRYLEEGVLTAGHARAILAIDDENEQIAWADRAVNEGLSVREVEKTSRDRRRPTGRRRRRRVDPQVRAIEELLEQHLGTRVRLSPRGRGGVLAIEYYSPEELEGILEKMGVEGSL
jgi:ParB family chromosome partitioning protein